MRLLSFPCGHELRAAAIALRRRRAPAGNALSRPKDVLARPVDRRARPGAGGRAWVSAARG